MIANQVLQTNIEGMKNITRVDICVMDTEGKALATTIDNVEEYEEEASYEDEDFSEFAEFGYKDEYEQLEEEYTNEDA